MKSALSQHCICLPLSCSQQHKFVNKGSVCSQVVGVQPESNSSAYCLLVMPLLHLQLQLVQTFFTLVYINTPSPPSPFMQTVVVVVFVDKAKLQNFNSLHNTSPEEDEGAAAGCLCHTQC